MLTEASPQLRELGEKYAECMDMLHEAQEELKNLRNKTMPNTASRRYHSLGLFPMVSASCAPGPRPLPALAARCVSPSAHGPHLSCYPLFGDRTCQLPNSPRRT